MPRVLFVDDHPLVAVALTQGVRQAGLDAEYVPVPDVVRATARESRHRGGLVVLDLDLGEGPDGRPLDGTALVPGIRAAGWAVLLLSGSRERPRIAAAVAAGALGILSKSLPFDQIVAAVVAAARGGVVFDPVERTALVAEHHASADRDRERERRWNRLTPRERHVLSRLVAGKRVADVARESVVSLATVRTQVRSILAKLEVRSQLEAVAFARDAGLVSG